MGQLIIGAGKGSLYRCRSFVLVCDCQSRVYVPGYCISCCTKVDFAGNHFQYGETEGIIQLEKILIESIRQMGLTFMITRQ